MEFDDLFDDALNGEAASVDVLAGGDPMTQAESEIAASDVDMAAIDAMDIFNYQNTLFSVSRRFY